MKQVYSDSQIGKVHALRIMLGSHGIPAIVQGEIRYGIREQSAPSVWVPDEDYQKAMELVRAFENPLPDTQVSLPEWRCPSCGEQIEDQFTQCWNCGAERKPESD